MGGDFYDFIELPDGLIGLVVGDVTDKGVPAALVMATTHSILRAEAPAFVSPSKVLERANDLLVQEIPPQMFVTCLYGVLDPATGRLRYANAGHNLPMSAPDGVVELRATGMPLGAMPDMTYEEKEATLAPGDTVLLHSDGLVEAHNREREMFGFPRLAALTGCSGGRGADRPAPGGARWVHRARLGAGGRHHPGRPAPRTGVAGGRAPEPRGRADLLPLLSEATSAWQSTRWPPRWPIWAYRARLERLKTAVGETAMNAIEYGSENRPDITFEDIVIADELAVRANRPGGVRPIPGSRDPRPGPQAGRGPDPAGLGPLPDREQVDELRTVSTNHYTIELVMHLKEAPDARS